MTFKASFSGKELDIYPARVSKIPYNQVYIGRERPLDQTEIAEFVSVSLDSPGELCVEAPELFMHPIEIRPLGANIPQRSAHNKLYLQLNHPGQFVIESGGRHTVLHVFVNRPFHYEHTENEIYFGPGIHEAGTISPLSGQTVCLDEGAVVYGHLKLVDVHDVKIVGRGILDASRISRDSGNNMTNPDYMMNTLFVARNCQNISVEGIIFRDAPLWGVVTRNGCKDILFDNIKLIGFWRYNSDGIDICASQNITIRNSFIRAYDDCFVARGAYLHGETEAVSNVTLENCVLWNDWGKAMEIWAGHLPCVIENVTCKNIHVIHMSWMIADITTWFGSNDTKIRNITFENITADVNEPLYDQIIEGEEDFEFRTTWKGPVVTVDCGRLGQNLGNQAWGDCTNISNHHITYEALAFKNFKINNPTKPFIFAVGSDKPQCVISNVLIDLPQNCSFTQIGAVDNLIIQ